MECKNRHTGCCSIDMGRGAKFCNCGENPEAEMCEGCFKLHAADWLADYPENFPDDVFEVRFKNTRRSYYRNVNNLPLGRGDIVAVEASPGHDVGIVSLTGDMVARQMKRTGFNPMNGEFKKIYRKAKPYDIEKWQEAVALEHTTMIRSRQIAAEMGLNMKIGDVEYQGDRIKAIFYYIADERVDFRELIKVFADQFRVRVEMKQIGARQEAGRIGGLGSCGRELCCASWIASFQSVTTGAARQQEISLNPQKLAGQCSKLKCCLTYELDTYLDARRALPRVSQPLQALDGEYYLVKTDILAGTMSFATSPGGIGGMVTLSADRVREILAVNRRGEKIDAIVSEVKPKPSAEEHSFVNMIGEESITRFDRGKGDGRNRNRGGRDRSRGRNGDPRREANGRPDNGEGREAGPNRPKEGNRGSRPGGDRRDDGQNRRTTAPAPQSQGKNANDRSGSRAQDGNGPSGQGVPRHSQSGNRRNRPRPGGSEHKPGGTPDGAQ